jgi:hypothetical protein
MVTVPVWIPVMIPLLGSMEATVVSLLDQETPLFIWLRLPSS